MKIVVALTAAVLAATLAPRAAHADVDREGVVLYGLWMVPSAVFLTNDLVNVSGHSLEYGGAEAAYNGFFAAGFSVAASLHTSGSDRTRDCLFAGAHAALMVHGIYVMLTHEDPDAATVTVGSARANLTIAPVSDGRDAHAGLAMVGTF